MKKSLIYFALTLFVLAAALLVWQRIEATRYADRFPFDPARKREATWLRMIAASGDTVTLERDAAGWRVARDGFPGDSARIFDALASLHALQVKERVSLSQDTARLVTYGLNGARATLVEWGFATGDTFRVSLGAPEIPEYDSSSRDYGTAFWKFTDKPEVYRAAYGNLWGRVSEDDWRKRRLIPDIVYEDVQWVETVWRDSLGRTRHYRLERASDTSAVMTIPRNAAGPTPVPRENAGLVFRQVPQFTVDAYVTTLDTTFTPTGVDTPGVIVTFAMKDGRTFKIEAGNIVGQHRYVKMPDAPGILVKVFSWRFGFFRKTVAQLLDPNLIPPDGEIKDSMP